MKYKAICENGKMTVQTYINSYEKWIDCDMSLMSYDFGAWFVRDTLIERPTDKNYSVICKVHEVKDGYRVVPVEIEKNSDGELHSPFDADSDKLLDMGELTPSLNVCAVYDDVKLSAIMLEMYRVVGEFSKESMERLVRKTDMLKKHTEMSVLFAINPTYAPILVFEKIRRDIIKHMVDHFNTDTWSSHLSHAIGLLSDIPHGVSLHLLGSVSADVEDGVDDIGLSIILPLLFTYMLFGVKNGLIPSNKNCVTLLKLMEEDKND